MFKLGRIYGGKKIAIYRQSGFCLGSRVEFTPNKGPGIINKKNFILQAASQG